MLVRLTVCEAGRFATDWAVNLSDAGAVWRSGLLLTSSETGMFVVALDALGALMVTVPLHVSAVEPRPAVLIWTLTPTGEVPLVEVCEDGLTTSQPLPQLFVDAEGVNNI